MPAALRGHERVTVVPGGDVDPDVMARWAVHVWTPRLLGDEIVDDARLFEEASCAGVASIMPAAALGGVDGFVSSHVLVERVDDPEEWYDALHHVLDDPGVRAARAGEATRRADALDSLAIVEGGRESVHGPRVRYRPRTRSRVTSRCSRHDHRAGLRRARVHRSVASTASCATRPAAFRSSSS